MKSLFFAIAILFYSKDTKAYCYKMYSKGKITLLHILSSNLEIIKMSTTKFTAENTALLLIDHQVGTMKLIKNIPLEEVQKKTLALAKMAKILNIPVVLTSSQEYAAQGPLMPELAETLPDAFEKRIKREGTVNCWEHKGFHEAVLATGKKNLI